ncbi:copper amine oxidase N-terminal domain-containing protein [Paenibacillus abyssi]|uniref:Copper amine oxidase-like N-terminal domain-containing protein n=1 Tax=Paenibacillus abyssi TaxID=1340531 RepID=A0A917FMV7_9BACL|nr:copper amine oxidase N-terminal domain-containing protein [Paenibacillus abyssi]GGF93286.1 hypothetical protein GCM10010916_08310 [Paenibacillus abyssi]
MKRDKVKGLVAGLLIGSLVSGSAVFAASGSMIEVFYNVKDIKINKVSKTPNEQPFIYKGTTFVPLRFVSESLGQQVKWDSKNQAVWIGETEEETAVYPGNGIEYMNYQEGYYGHGATYEYNTTDVIKDNTGQEYSSFITMFLDDTNTKNSWNKIEFPLNSQYKSFKSKFGLTDEYKNTTRELKLTILLDEKIVLEKRIVAGGFPEDINIDIKNANKITFQFSSSGENYIDSQIGLFDARFIK